MDPTVTPRAAAFQECLAQRALEFITTAACSWNSSPRAESRPTGRGTRGERGTVGRGSARAAARDAALPFRCHVPRLGRSLALPRLTEIMRFRRLEFQGR